MRKKFLLVIAKRLAISCILLFLLATMVFILLRISPGDPTLKFVSPHFSKELAEKTYESYGLNQSLFVQYSSFVKNLFLGNFGSSYSFRRPVLDVVLESFSFTALLALTSFVVQIFIAVLLVAIFWKMSAKIKNRVHKILMTLYGIPSFIFAIFLVYIFSIWLGLLPTSGLYNNYRNDAGFLQLLFQNVKHLVLPVITLSIAGIVIFYNYINDQVSELEKETFILKLKSEGIDDRKIFISHILPNSLGPFITIAGIELGYLLSGAVITEVIFGLPGLGRLSLEAILSRDYPLIVGATIFTSFFIIFVNFAADFFRALLDKRFLEKMVV